MNFKILALLALVLVLVGCNQNDAKPPVTNLETEDDRFSYGLGMIISERVLKQYGDIDYDILLAGMKAHHQHQDTLITFDEATAALDAHSQKMFADQSSANRERGEAFLKKNAETEGVQMTESGLQYSVITQGDGAKPKATDQVTVHYRGTLIDDTEFDSSYSRGSPASFALNQVIAGWTEGVQLMNVGSKFRFVIPYNLAYGERGAGGSIGPFETLIFEVELIEIGS